MIININKQIAIGTRDQIKRQIKMQIGTEAFAPGRALPSVRDLASFLRVNRNTVAQAYRELVSEGVLETRPGSGTFVRAQPMITGHPELRPIFEEAVRRARDQGFGLAEITESFLSFLAALPAEAAVGPLLVVECNEPTLEHLGTLLSDALAVHAEGILIQDLEKDPAGFRERFADSALIVCGFNHLEEIAAALPGFQSKTIGIMLQPDARIIHMLSTVPKGATVGYVCVNQRSADTFYNSAYFSGHRTLKRIIAGANDTENLNKVIADCDIVYVTNFALERLTVEFRPGQKVIRVDITVDRSNLDYIKEKLENSAQARAVSSPLPR